MLLTEVTDGNHYAGCYELTNQRIHVQQLHKKFE